MTTDRALPRIALHSSTASARGVGEGLYPTTDGPPVWATCVTKDPATYERLYPDAVRVGVVPGGVGPSLVEHADPPVSYLTPG